MAAKKRRITAEDLYNLELITNNEISQDGENVIYSLQWVEKKTEKKFQNLWIVPTRRGAARQFTFGEHVDSAPQWSPDGKTIAFLSNRKDEAQFQIYLIPVDGGEARPLTDMKGNFGAFEWSPDGRQFLVEFTKMDKDVLERKQDPQKEKLGIVSRHITRVFFKMDGTGYLPQEKQHLWLLNARTGKAKQITDHKVFSEGSARLSPDGKQIAFISNRYKDPDFELEGADIYLMPASGGRMRKINTVKSSKGQLSFSPDGKKLAYFGNEPGKNSWTGNSHLFIMTFNAKTPVQNLTKKFDFDVSSWTINDTQAPAQTPPTWSNDGSRIYFQVARHGNTVLKVIDVKSREVKDVVAEDGVVGSFSFNQDQDKLAYYSGNMRVPNQIILKDKTSGKTKQLTKTNTWLNRVDLGKIEEVWFKGGDKNDLQGWILKPPGFRSNRKYPSILEIHGGPQLQYGNYFMHEFYYLASKGFVVYFSNPRGGQGYGEKHLKSIYNKAGTVDYDDLMAWTNYVSRKPYIDKQKMGVTGGSYGGFMTAWIIGQTHRFKAAVAQRAVTNQISMWGSSDFNWIFQLPRGDQPPYENLNNYWRQSPMKHIGNAKTPTLVIHSEQDKRVAQEQGEQLYVALKHKGVDTELVLFPDSPHGLSRVGRTDRRIARLNHILRWFEKYLKK